MLKYNKDSKRLPPGGHQFKEYGMVFKGDSLEAVCRDLANFRLNNNIPAGNPEQEILAHYVKNWPWLVKDDRVSKDAEDMGNYSKWREWIYMVWKTPPKKVIAPKLAAERWAVCKDCPYNVPFAWKDSKESEELTRRAYMLRRAIDVPKGLGFCSLHKADIGLLSVLEDAKTYSNNKSEKNYPDCWIK